MRLEQLVIFGPSDNFTMQFGPRLTVLAGLEPTEREALVKTVVDGLAGRLPNASVIFTDATGRRIYADRTGATYADTGLPAPSLVDLLGSDPDVVADLVTVNAGDLGLGTTRDREEVDVELTAVRAMLEQLAAERSEAETILERIQIAEARLADVDDQLELAPEAAARWAWIAKRAELDDRRAELASLDHADLDRGDGDDRLLDAVEELRSAGETWAEASAAAEELGQQLGALPPVSEGDLSRVAATPESLPDDFDERLRAVEVTTEIRIASEEAVVAAARPTEDPGDGIVYHLAQLPQDELWRTYDAASTAIAAYEGALADLPADADAEDEVEIEAAHHEVVRCQREVDRRFRPGTLGTGTLAVSALLAGHGISLILGFAMLAAAVAMAWWLLVLPRRALAEASAAEEVALGGSEADTWLGLHLRRIDDHMPTSDRSELNVAVDQRARTRLDWEELVGSVTLESAGSRRAAVQAYAESIDPKARHERERRALDAVAAAREQEADARRQLAAGLGGYGLSVDGVADLDSTQVRQVLEQRMRAGRFARQALELHHHTATATSAGALLDRLLRDLGFDDGDLAGRLDRAIVAVEGARRRTGSGDTTRDELVAEIDRLSAIVDAGRRLSWDLTPDPSEPPPAVEDLQALRSELASTVARGRRPDLNDIDRRTSVTSDRAKALEAELSAMGEGTGALHRRLSDRMARTAWVDEREESLPVLLDDALVDVNPAELFPLLDMVQRISGRTQVIIASGDPTITRWARRESATGTVTLFEVDGVAS